MHSASLLRRTFSIGLLPVALVAPACTSKSTDAGANGSAVVGATDSHCGAKTQVVDQATCHARSPVGVDAGTAQDQDASSPPEDVYGPTLFNADGDDDQCKYHAKWTVAGARSGGTATFTVVATSKTDGTPLTGAKIRAEVYLDETHPAPNTDQAPTESTPGTYAVGPIKFDAPGRWIVRFHFFEDCNDGDESPHGHVAFFLDIP